MPRYVNDIIVHAAGADAARDYHYFIARDGTCTRSRALSRPGKHCMRHNAHSVGVAYESEDCARDTRTKEQKYALLKLVTRLTALYRCPAHGHRDYEPTPCPGFDAAAEYGGLLRQFTREIS